MLVLAKTLFANKLHSILPAAIMTRCFPRLGTYVGAVYCPPAMSEEEVTKKDNGR